MNIQVDIENLENKAFISAFGKNYVVINKNRYFDLLFFSNNEIKTFVNPINVFDDKVLKHLFLVLKNFSFDLVLFGTGKNLIKVPVQLKKFLVQNKYSFEIMNSISAYNTHNILLSEKRNIVSIIKLT
ncbi:MAG: hypothetical protein CMJ06_04560 [Pelagibacterales bacterium]|nr:hypothetical protein [Pelagibacterales bacterium]OUU61982.1 MAG: hypothetical protein CBC22_06010 [Alphaproteobacteria bacterium TMED62]